jgi:hypothetical protein
MPALCRLQRARYTECPGLLAKLLNALAVAPLRTAVKFDVEALIAWSSSQ